LGRIGICSSFWNSFICDQTLWMCRYSRWFSTSLLTIRYYNDFQKLGTKAALARGNNDNIDWKRRYVEQYKNYRRGK
jgi:hypothetical protein